VQSICSKQGAAVVRRGIGRVLCRKRLADANNHLSRESKMSSTRLTTVGVTRPAEKARLFQSMDFGHQSFGGLFFPENYLVGL